MSLTKTAQPYEFLVRWNDGAISGAHIRFIETISDGNEVISQKEGHAQPVSLAGESGFPLSSILTALQEQALSDLATAQAKVTQLTADLAAAQAQIPVPSTGTVTMRQARLALLHAGKYHEVDAAINALDEPTKSAAKIEWEYASTVERSSQFVTLLGAALGLDEAALDELFAFAATV